MVYTISCNSAYLRTGGKAVVDSAFSKKRCPFPVKLGNHKPGESVLETTICRQATSLPQSAEWGMRAAQGSFPRLKDKLLYLENMSDCKLFLN